MEIKPEVSNVIELASEKVRRNVTVITPESLGQNYLLHISADTRLNRVFVPFIGERQDPREDRSFPRVCTSPSIIGCMMGHAVSDYAFLNHVPSIKNRYRGGYVIFGFPFEYALRPDVKLVIDAQMSDECWLFTYNKETVSFKPKLYGKLFYRSITFVGNASKKPEGEAVIIVEVLHEKGLQFSKNIHLNKGYHQVDGPLFPHLKNTGDDKEFHVKSLTQAEYTSIKVASADLLSYDTPKYLSW